MDVLCTWVKLLTDLQILGCELHKNLFGGRASHGPAGRAIALPRPTSRYKGKGRERRGRKWLGIGREMKGTEGRERGGRAQLGYLSRGSPSSQSRH